MNKIIYHGSEHIIEKPVYKGGKPYNDYGYGFYCTENSDVAKEWAVTELHDGYANEYSIKMTGLKVLKLNEEYNILHWLTVLLENRIFNTDSPLANEAKRYLVSNFHIDMSIYDIVIGYRADDSYFSFAQDFLNGTISVKQLKTAMSLGGLGEQFVLKSKRAFESLTFSDAKAVSRSDYLEKRKKRDMQARKEYYNIDRQHFERGQIYIFHILDEEIKPDDVRIQ